MKKWNIRIKNIYGIFTQNLFVQRIFYLHTQIIFMELSPEDRIHHYKRNQETITKLIKEHLQRVREEKGLTQKDVRDVTGIKQARLSKIEAGIQPITLDDFILLSLAYGTTLDYLIEPSVFSIINARDAGDLAE